MPTTRAATSSSRTSTSPAEAGHRTRRGPGAAGRLTGAGVLLLALLLVGCSGDASSAQEAQLPTDDEVLRQRADRARVQGADDAAVTMVEISDFQCPYCQQFYRETLPALDSLYIETGKVRYIFLVYPSSSHKLAWPAAEAAYCAGSVGKFWEMHDLLFERQGEWSGSASPVEVFAGYAEEIGVDRSSFVDCLENDRTAPLQVRDLERISRAGISATPFFIFDSSVSLRGAAPLERFRAVLDSALAAGDEAGASDSDTAAAAPGEQGGQDGAGGGDTEEGG